MLFLGFLLLNLCAPTLARFMVEKNSLAVTSPDSIRGTHDSAIGNFGIPKYGGSMAGTVVNPKDNRKGCRSFEGTPYKSKPGALPNFVLVDCGGTLFVFSSSWLVFNVFFLWILHWCLKLTD